MLHQYILDIAVSIRCLHLISLSALRRARAGLGTSYTARYRGKRERSAERRRVGPREARRASGTYTHFSVYYVLRWYCHTILGPRSELDFAYRVEWMDARHTRGAWTRARSHRVTTLHRPHGAARATVAGCRAVWPLHDRASGPRNSYS